MRNHPGKVEQPGKKKWGRIKMYKSNNWKKMHHIPIKSKTINGYEIKIIKLNEYCSPRSKKKKEKVSP